MTLVRARVLKNDRPAGAGRELPAADAADALPRARIVRGAVVEAKAEAGRILAAARAEAAALGEAAAAAAADEARARETARLAAGFVALREAQTRRLDDDKDRLVALATVLAERLLGEALRVEPQRIADLAAVAIEEARGAARIRIDASPEDVGSLRETLAELGARVAIDVTADPALDRGSLVLHTDLGRIDAHLAPQLARLATALREALA